MQTYGLEHMHPSRKLLRIKVTPDLHLIENEKYSFYLIFIDKTLKYTYLYLFKFVLHSIVAFKAN